VTCFRQRLRLDHRGFEFLLQSGTAALREGIRNLPSDGQIDMKMLLIIGAWGCYHPDV